MLYPRGAVLCPPCTLTGASTSHACRNPPLGPCSKALPAQSGVEAALFLPFPPTSSLPRLGPGTPGLQLEVRRLSVRKSGAANLKGHLFRPPDVLLTPSSWLCGPSMCRIPGIPFMDTKSINVALEVPGGANICLKLGPRYTSQPGDQDEAGALPWSTMGKHPGSFHTVPV